VKDSGVGSGVGLGLTQCLGANRRILIVWHRSLAKGNTLHRKDHFNKQLSSDYICSTKRATSAPQSGKAVLPNLSKIPFPCLYEVPYVRMVLTTVGSRILKNSLCSPLCGVHDIPGLGVSFRKAIGNQLTGSLEVLEALVCLGAAPDDHLLNCSSTCGCIPSLHLVHTLPI